MTTDALLKILVDRGLKLARSPRTGEPVLVGRKGEATPALMRVVALHRDALLAQLGDQPAARAEAGPEKPPPPTARASSRPNGDWWWRGILPLNPGLPARAQLRNWAGGAAA